MSQPHGAREGPRGTQAGPAPEAGGANRACACPAGRAGGGVSGRRSDFRKSSQDLLVFGVAPAECYDCGVPEDRRDLREQSTVWTLVRLEKENHVVKNASCGLNLSAAESPLDLAELWFPVLCVV